MEDQAKLYAHLRQSRQADEILNLVLETEQLDHEAVPLARIVAGLSSSDM